MTVVCSVCDKHFSKNSNLIRHIARIHSESCTLKPSTSHSFICEHCNQSFSRKQNLKRHLLVHASTFNERCKIVCMYCLSNGISKKIVTCKLLQKHCVKVHDVELQEEIKRFTSKSGRKNAFRMQLSIL